MQITLAGLLLTSKDNPQLRAIIQQEEETEDRVHPLSRNWVVLQTTFCWP
jgi:hypothetical protein